MLARNAYGTSLGENSYGMPGQPKSGQPKPGVSPYSPNMDISQPQRSMDFSAYAPGRAQPIPPQSQGTPFQAYSQPDSSASYRTSDGGVPRSYSANAYQNNAAGNYGNSVYGRPDPFSYTATGIGGQQFSDPSQAFTQRDAMIQRINEARAPMFAGGGTYQGPGMPPPAWGQKPQMDFNTLMGQANNMMAGGWQNPVAQQFQEPSFSPAPGTQDYGQRPQGWDVPDERFIPDAAPPQGPYGQPQWSPTRSTDYPTRFLNEQQQYGPQAEQWGGSQTGGGAPPWSSQPEPRWEKVYGQTKRVGSQPSGYSSPERGQNDTNDLIVDGTSRLYIAPTSGSSVRARQWRDNQTARVSSGSNQRWLASQTPSNRSIYGMMQRMY